MCLQLTPIQPLGALGPIIKEFELSEELATLTISLFVAGYIFGPLLWGPLSETYGRKAIFMYPFMMYTVRVSLHNSANPLTLYSCSKSATLWLPTPPLSSYSVSSAASSQPPLSATLVGCSLTCGTQRPEERLFVYLALLRLLDLQYVLFSC